MRASARGPEWCELRSAQRGLIPKPPSLLWFWNLIVSTYRFVFRRPCFRYPSTGVSMAPYLLPCRESSRRCFGILRSGDIPIRLEDRSCKIGVSEEVIRRRRKQRRIFPTLGFRQKSQADVAPGNGAYTGRFYAQLRCLPFLLLLSRKVLASYGPKHACHTWRRESLAGERVHLTHLVDVPHRREKSTAPRLKNDSNWRQLIVKHFIACRRIASS